MLKEARENWQQFMESEPGSRFEKRYRRRQETGQRHILLRVFVVVIGFIIAVGSLVLAPLPGPGWGTVFIGLMILAGEVLIAARFLDRAEIRVRKLTRRFSKIWKRSSPLGKALIYTAGLACSAAFIYLAYYLLFLR